MEMYKLYLKDIRLPKETFLQTLSDRTAGVSGADIANIANAKSMVFKITIKKTLYEKAIYKKL